MWPRLEEIGTEKLDPLMAVDLRPFPEEFQPCGSCFSGGEGSGVGGIPCGVLPCVLVEDIMGFTSEGGSEECPNGCDGSSSPDRAVPGAAVIGENGRLIRSD